MEVKQILEKVRQPKEEKKEYFFALQIDNTFVKSAIWTVDRGRVKVVSLGMTHQWQDEEGLIEAIDKSLSSATEKFFPENEAVEPSKVIFGLLPEWVKGEKIIGGKIDVLKTLSQKLELRPVGFVVTTEALIHHLKETEGVPPTAILVGLDEKRFTVALTNLGKIIGREVVKRSGQSGADLTEGLLRFGNEAQFPARILLYEQGGNLAIDLEKTKQELINYSWQEEGVNFLHLPKVEVLPGDFDIKAVALAGGHEVAKAEGIDVLGIEPEKEAAASQEEKKAIEEEPEVFGFVKGRDISQKETQEEIKQPWLNLPRFRFSGFDFSGIKTALTKFSLGSRPSLVTVLVGGLLFITGGVLVALYWYLPRAEVLLLIKPKRIENEFELKMDPSLELTDRENLALPAEELEMVIEGEKERETTGIKAMGEPAKGEVTIYNRTASKKTFSAGTELVGPDKLKFSLDEETTVASESAGSDYTKVPGKAMAKVTASAIGTEGNLAFGTEFSLDKFAQSDFVAKNESAFSGGTSREIQVVSKDDQARLMDELKKELEGQAIEKLLAEVSSGKKLIEESLSTEVLEKSFDKAVDEEANQVKLKLKMKARVLSYIEEKLQALIEEEIEKSIPAGFEYKRTESEISFELKGLNQDGSATFTAYFKANLVPELDLEEIRNSLAGKYLHFGQTYLENLSHVEAVEIKISPRLPERLVTFPRLTRRIEIEVEIESQ